MTYDEIVTACESLTVPEVRSLEHRLYYLALEIGRREDARLAAMDPKALVIEVAGDWGMYGNPPETVLEPMNRAGRDLVIALRADPLVENAVTLAVKRIKRLQEAARHFGAWDTEGREVVGHVLTAALVGFDDRDEDEYWSKFWLENNIAL